jgi:hypothetical protein
MSNNSKKHTKEKPYCAQEEAASPYGIILGFEASSPCSSSSCTEQCVHSAWL